jgi:hypothetical protein
MLTRSLKMSPGSIELFQKRVCMFPVRLFVYLIRDVHGSGDSSLVYRSARRDGFDWFKGMLELSQVRNNEEIIRLGADILTMAGWGRFEFKELDLKQKRMLVEVSDSSVVEEYLKEYGVSKHVVDDVLRGFFAGGACLMVEDGSYEFLELSCRAKGDLKCLMQGKTRSECDLSNDFVKFQLGESGEAFDVSFLKARQVK